MNKLIRGEVVTQEIRRPSRVRTYFRTTSTFLSERWKFRKELKTLREARRIINCGISILDATMDCECIDHPRKERVSNMIRELITNSSTETLKFISRESKRPLTISKVTNGDYFVAGEVRRTLAIWEKDNTVKLVLLETSAQYMQHAGAYTESQRAAIAALTILARQPADFDRKEERVRGFFKIYAESLASKIREMSDLGLSINTSMDRVSNLRELADAFPQFEGLVAFAVSVLREQLRNLA